MTKPKFSSIIRVFKMLGHASFVLFFLLLPFSFVNQTTNPIRTFNPFFSFSYWIYFISFITYFYSFTYFIIPRYLLRKQYWKFTGILILFFLFFSLVKPFELIFQDILVIMKGQQKRPYDPLVIDYLTTFIFIMLTALGLSIQFVKQWRLSEKRTLQAEADKANAELSFLKAQINPHFLFNTLNNIYSLAVIQSDNTALAIMQLSNIMRYITSDVGKEFVTLEREMGCIHDYINLQRLRLGQNTRVNFEVTGETANKKIAPLILMTFIENNFKYGVSKHEKSDITIRLVAEESRISFFSRNKIFTNQTHMENTGIGLSNTRQRLELAYPNKHLLDINSEDGFYTVYLTLQE